MPEGLPALAQLMRQTSLMDVRNERQEAISSGPGLEGLYSLFMALPALRGLWTAGSIDNAGNVYDYSLQGRTLSQTNVPILTRSGVNNMVPACLFTGTQYFQRASEAGFNIIGNEANVASVVRGLTIGGWFYTSSSTGGQGMAGKRNATGNQKSYLLEFGGSQTVSFLVSTDGINDVSVNGTVSLPLNGWGFGVGRYIPSTSIDVYTNYEGASGDTGKQTNTTSIPATLFSSTAAFQLAAFNAGVNLLSGAFALCFLCAANLTDAQIAYLFHRSRALFGV